MNEAREDLPVTTPERYDGANILARFRELREQRRAKVKPGVMCRYVVPCRVFEGEIVEVQGDSVTIRTGNTTLQTTLEYVIPRKVDDGK